MQHASCMMNQQQQVINNRNGLTFCIPDRRHFQATLDCIKFSVMRVGVGVWLLPWLLYYYDGCFFSLCFTVIGPVTIYYVVITHCTDCHHHAITHNEPWESRRGRENVVTYLALRWNSSLGPQTKLRAFARFWPQSTISGDAWRLNFHSFIYFIIFISSPPRSLWDRNTRL